MTELDHRKSGSAERLYFVHTWYALPQNGCNKLQNFSRSGSGQVNVGQNGVFRMAILRLIFSCLLKWVGLDILQIDVNGFIIWCLSSGCPVLVVLTYRSRRFCASLKRFGVLKVEEQIKVTGVNPKCVHRGAKGHNLAIYNTWHKDTTLLKGFFIYIKSL